MSDNVLNTKDNIAAISSGISGAVCVVKCSGPGVLEIARSVFSGGGRLNRENARKMLLGRVAGDTVLAVYMPGPASYTGDDVVEFHSHGGAAAAGAVLKSVLDGGCRMAEPGEFTFRAFVNGKMDLLQAESVAELVSAGSELALRSAEKRMDGALSDRIGAIREKVFSVLSECESDLDFSESDLELDPGLPDRLAEAAAEVDALLKSAAMGKIIRQGVSVALAGEPNAGKSSLLNRLLGYERTIVSDIPGTTRDTVEESLSIREIPVKITDTAGLRDDPGELEKLGMERSYREFQTSQLVLLVLDARRPERLGNALAALEGVAAERIAVWNKCDLAGFDAELPATPFPAVRISALTGEGMCDLEDAFERTIKSGGGDWENPEFAVNARTAELLEEVKTLLPEAERELRANRGELAAADLHRAVLALGKITGENAEPDLLEAVFRRFCIGK